MYKPNLVENLGRYIPNPPRHAPRILPDQSLVAIVETKKNIIAIDVSHFFLIMKCTLRTFWLGFI